MANKKVVIVFVLIIATTLAELEDEFDEENMSPNPSVAPLPSIDIEAPNSEYYNNNNDDDIDEHLYDSDSSSAPSPSPIPAGFMSSGSDDDDDDDGIVSPSPRLPVLPFNYTAEDDAGEITNESFHVVEKQNTGLEVRRRRRKLKEAIRSTFFVSQSYSTQPEAEAGWSLGPGTWVNLVFVNLGGDLSGSQKGNMLLSVK
ncbi:hypothetical protein PIB30_015841 [Stylosanthes scabra]|uniref:Uncharacterized protein n=1 Tax=Stylosanthes scabra TaxID=79078 RepID=A0ABU6R7F9_9FABA|nr:hypothetical protein [Stylosanthes scabra]